MLYSTCRKWLMQIINKILTAEDVDLLNADKNPSVVLKNTAGQSVDIISKLSPRVRIQIIGGYDGDKKKKYNEKRIQARTFYSPSEVCAIISKFEEYEKGINASWSDLEKAIYIYKKFAETIVYEEDNGVRSRNLNAVLGKAVCAGYSSIFKEAMDRLGVECDIINEPRVHTWNAIKIEDKWYPLDLTWDANNIQNKGIDNLGWFGQNPAFNKYNYHNALGEDVIPNNCFDSRMIADILNKIENTNRYKPINHEDVAEKIFANVLNAVSQGHDLDGITGGIKELAEFAFKVENLYNDTAYAKDFDQKFGDIFKSIRSNQSLTDEQKSILLRTTNNTWSDVMGKINIGNIRESLRLQILSSLRAMNLMMNNGDYNAVDKQFIETQLRDVYEKCTSYGVVDFEKVEEMAKRIDNQVAEMRKAKDQHREIGTLDTEIKIAGPIQIVKVQPVKQNDIRKWASQQIAQYESLINGIKESGDDIEDAETKEIISACQQQLDYFYVYYKQLEDKYIQGRQNEN